MEVLMSGQLPSLRFYITPSEDLLQECCNNDSPYAELLRQRWECDIERRGRSDWTMDDYETLAKISLLARVFEYKNEEPELFALLVQSTSASAVEIFDKWWTIQRVRADEYIDCHIAECGADAVQSLPMTGRPAVDYWLRNQQETMKKAPDTDPLVGAKGRQK